MSEAAKDMFGCPIVGKFVLDRVGHELNGTFPNNLGIVESEFKADDGKPMARVRMFGSLHPGSSWSRDIELKHLTLLSDLDAMEYLVRLNTTDGGRYRVFPQVFRERVTPTAGQHQFYDEFGNRSDSSLPKFGQS